MRLDKDGKFDSKFGTVAKNKRYHECQQNMFFTESNYGTFIPRCVFVDTDSQTINDVLESDLQNLIPYSYAISGNKSSVIYLFLWKIQIVVMWKYLIERADIYRQSV